MARVIIKNAVVTVGTAKNKNTGNIIFKVMDKNDNNPPTEYEIILQSGEINIDKGVKVDVEGQLVVHNHKLWVRVEDPFYIQPDSQSLLSNPEISRRDEVIARDQLSLYLTNYKKNLT